MGALFHRDSASPARARHNGKVCPLLTTRIGWLDLDGSGAHYFTAELRSICGAVELPDYLADGPDPVREAAIIQFARRERGAGQRCPGCLALVAALDNGEAAI